MAMKSVYRKQIEAEAKRVQALTAAIAVKTEAQLAMDLLAIEAEMRELDHERRVSPNDAATVKYHAFQWGRLSEKANLVRAELNARRQSIAA